MVTFSDESRFCLRHIDGWLRVWRRNGERHPEVNVQPRHAYNGGSVMVWAGVTADRRTDLVVVPGILTGQGYIDEFLRPRVVPFLRPMGNNGIFQDDNARLHHQRWNKVWQVKMNSQCQNDEIKLLIFLFCLRVVSLLSIAVQWNSVVSTWRFSFILRQRSRDNGISCLRFAGRWHFLCYDLHVLKVDPYHVEQLLKQFWSCLNDWNLFSIVGQWLLKNVIYDLWKLASPEAFYSPLFAVVHYFFDRVYVQKLQTDWHTHYLVSLLPLV